MKFFESVYEIVKQIPYGKVTNYGTIARLIGRSDASRIVGYALHANPDNSLIPCHRVVTIKGGLSRAFAFGGIEEHKRLLEKEGVFVGEDNKVDMNKYGWML